MVWGLGFGGLKFGVSGLGLGVWGFGIRVWGFLGLGFRDEVCWGRGLGCRN